MSLYVRVLMIITLLVASHVYAWRMGNLACTAKADKAAVKEYAKSNDKAEKVLKDVKQVEVRYRDRIVQVEKVVDDCTSRVVPAAGVSLLRDAAGDR